MLEEVGTVRLVAAQTTSSSKRSVVGQSDTTGRLTHGGCPRRHSSKKYCSDELPVYANPYMKADTARPDIRHRYARELAGLFP